jgi:hypothetical protein
MLPNVILRLFAPMQTRGAAGSRYRSGLTMLGRDGLQELIDDVQFIQPNEQTDDCAKTSRGSFELDPDVGGYDLRWKIGYRFAERSDTF